MQQLVHSLRTTLSELTIPQKVGMGSAIVVVLLAAAAFVSWVTQPSYTVLYSDLPEAQLSQVIDSLDAAGVPYRLEGGGSRIMVPRDSVYQARADLAADGIQGSVVPQGYELLDEQGLSVSDFRQRVDYQRALEGELARTLGAMDGVGAATVHLVIPEEALFAENQDPVTASVLIDPDGPTDESDIEAIVMLVASSVEGLEPSQVTVADTDGTVLNVAGEDSVTALGNRQLRMTADFESGLGGRINEMLESVLGPGRASVVVRAELDFDERSTESETYTPESATPLRQQTVDETFVGAGAPPVGSVGIDGEAVGTGDGDYEYERAEDTTEFGVDRLVVKSVEAPGAIERLSVAVVVDDGTETGMPLPNMGSIEELVTAAAGIQAERGDSLAVSAIPFPAAPETEPAVPEATGGIGDLVPTVIGALVIVVVAVALFLMSRSGRKRSRGAGDALGALPAPPLDGTEQMMAAGGPSDGLTDDVIQLVEKQPEEIATLLRSWLADRREPVS